MERLSELEGVVLGMLGSMGPMTAYSIRQFFLKSPSPQWASSAGTIYPLVQRLDKRGMIRSERHATGRREGLKYTLAPPGLKALKSWIGPELPAIATAVPVDSLRVRVRFMSVLPEKDRISMLKNARRELTAILKSMEKESVEKRSDKDIGLNMAYRGVIMMTKTRLAWIAEVEREFMKAGQKSKRA